VGNSSEDDAQISDTGGSAVVTGRIDPWQGDVMSTWVVLLRGVNVGGANRLAMADLRAVVTSLGHTDVTTYIQSGNIVLTSPEQDRWLLAAEICAGIERAHGLVVSAVLRTPGELSGALAVNPFADVAEGFRGLITFLSETPKPADAATLEPDRFVPDRFELRGAELYMHYPNGAGRSKMTLDYFEKRLHVRGTARNLNTVAKLIALAGG
jgi:uncharacterized protein (DUF1697 family)